MTKRVAKVLTLFVMTVGVCASPLAAGEAWAQGAARVAYIDVQRILARSSAGVAAREQLEKDKAAMQKDVDGKRGEVEKLREEIEKKGALLSADARKEKQETLERKVRDLRRIVDDYRAELERKEQGLLQKVLVDISGVVERVGKQKGFLMIVEKRGAGVIYGAPEADLTDEVIKAFDQEAAKAKK
ncbi:MAG: OmpH family outer membrane protein [Candidatus Rokubacteria bacterium]|nr:OmpH family outer membrane protein [Candidatus Rokubacteria bacterium]